MEIFTLTSFVFLELPLLSEFSRHFCNFLLFSVQLRVGLFSEMSHSKLVISVSDNPPDRAPRYPGKFNRNNIAGTTMTRDEWLQNHTDRWVMYMKDKPAYKQSYLSVRARVLHSHLSLTLSNLYRGKVEDKKCRKLLQDAEQRLLGVEQDRAEQEQMEEEHAHRDEKGDETRGMVIGEMGEDEREKYERERHERGEEHSEP